jgi:hypothetical protein
MNKKITLFVLTLILPLTIYSQQTNSISETEKIVDSFFKTYKERGYKEAIVNILSTNKWVSRQDADTVALQLGAIVEQVDKYYGHEKLTERHYGKSVVQYTFLVKYERQPLKFIFKFYKPDKTWNTQSFKYEVEFMDEMEESSKAYRMKDNIDK